MNFPNRLGGGCGQSASNRGFQEIEPICKPGLNFDSFSRDQLIGTNRIICVVALFVCLSVFLSGLPLEKRFVRCVLIISVESISIFTLSKFVLISLFGH